ncbi:MerR family transcriptional regulator [Limimaricola pyoseonensis]|uniref:DNA-binding transcriptional regulator, MerR family n=1 Tax=Limimaricola pyoseonensis TaxID=521013 RepID=A0A1G7ARS4_9RHOB|nr:MerR family transcriptional regulator [Limimaricola pyoseonensis]SDE17491.1 DNA-binding transcriptional regulator, MerR family [Limimaricola pyoseonensis]
MAKSAHAFRTIGEVSSALDTPAHVLRFWESKFPQVKPVKRAGGRRYYRPEDLALLGGIKLLLHEQGMTIKGVQKLLREKGVRHVADMSTLPTVSEDQIDAAPSPASSPAPNPVARGPEPEAAEVPHLAARPAPEHYPEAGRQAPRDHAAAADTAHSAGPLVWLGRADPARMKAQAARIAPLVARLAALRERMAGARDVSL